MADISGERTAFSPKVEKGLSRLSLSLFLPLNGYPPQRRLTAPSSSNRTAYSPYRFFLILTTILVVLYSQMFNINGIKVAVEGRIFRVFPRAHFLYAGPHWSNWQGITVLQVKLQLRVVFL